MANPAVTIENLSFTYGLGTTFASQALAGVNLTVETGKITAFVGHTGSGKSTLMQLVDGLLKPTQGSVTVQDVTVTNQATKEELAQLRQHVGFVFQFPESQLFADTVIQDVMFGPLNLGLDQKTARKQADQALQRLDFPEELYEHSPFELSGGQMRRVAIAGVLAMSPDILILDEPTAGLDPNGQHELMTLMQQLNHEGTTILLITHQMEQVADYADEVVALKAGRLVFTGQPRQLFSNQKLVQEIGLTVPATVEFAKQLQAQGVQLDPLPMHIEELAQQLAARQKGMTQAHGE